MVDFTVSAHIHSHLLCKVKAAFISSDQKTPGARAREVIHAEPGFNKQTKEKQKGCVCLLVNRAEKGWNHGLQQRLFLLPDDHMIVFMLDVQPRSFESACS